VKVKLTTKHIIWITFWSSYVLISRNLFVMELLLS